MVYGLVGLAAREAAAGGAAFFMITTAVLNSWAKIVEGIVEIYEFE